MPDINIKASSTERTPSVKNAGPTEETLSDQGKCCRDEGVPDICLGFCETHLNVIPRHYQRQIGICGKWFGVIGRCEQDANDSGINDCSNP